MRKGQATNAIFGLVLLIALFIVLFILLLPPEDRSNLLNQTTDSGTGNGLPSTGNGIETLVLESPGLVSVTEEDELEHKINPINLFVKSSPEIIELAASASLQKSLFSEKEQNFAFNVNDLENLEDAKLSFFVSEQEGKLLIKLNGNLIFQSEVGEGSRIVNLPTSYIGEQNELILSVSSPGLAFWKGNRYELQDIKVKTSFEKLNPQETRTFLLSENEIDSIENSELRYNIYCNSLEGEGSKFKVYLNDISLYSETIPDSCAGQRNVAIDKDELQKGENKLTFVIEAGDYQINDITIVNDVGETENLVYRFDISREDFQKIKDNEKDVLLDLTLGEKKERKRGDIVVNDQSFSFDLTADSYSKVLSSFIVEGENIVKIIPKNEFRLDLVKITLKD